MKTLFIKLLLVILPFGVVAQNNMDSVLSEIEKNNTTLKAYKELTKAQKLETHTGIYLENPEVGYGYLLGSPSAVGKKHNFSVSQSFNFPSAYRFKKQIAEANNEQFQLDYNLKRFDILTKAKMICNELIYLNAINRELQLRLKHATQISESYTAKLKNGDTNIIEKNKAALNLLSAKKEIEINEMERSALHIQLVTLNGGNQLNFNMSAYSLVKLPQNFNDWFSNIESKIPNLQQSKNQVLINEKEIQLNKALALPKFSTGYMSEKVTKESFKGIKLGVTIPLWENKNTVKLARAKKITSEKVASDSRIQFYNRLKMEFERAKKLQQILMDYHEVLPSINNTVLLKKALDAGELSLIEYMLELSLYYETINKILETEKDLNQAVAALYFFE
jgi:outer membrane protein TolC